jgi:hypothetical protein
LLVGAELNREDAGIKKSGNDLAWVYLRIFGQKGLPQQRFRPKIEVQNATA